MKTASIPTLASPSRLPKHRAGGTRERRSGVWTLKTKAGRSTDRGTRRLHVVVLGTDRRWVDRVTAHVDSSQTTIVRASDVDAARAALGESPGALFLLLHGGESVPVSAVVRELRPLDVPMIALADRAALAGVAVDLGAEAVVVPRPGEPLGEAGLRALEICRALGGRTTHPLHDGSMVIHDLRTPLNALLAVEEELSERGVLGDTLGGIARRSIRQLRSLVDRLEAPDTAPPLQPERVCVATLAEDLAAQLARTGDGPSIVVRGDSSAECDADRVLLERVLMNLLGNARRHASSQVEVRVRSRRGVIRVAVLDDGPGLPDSNREALFERFVRGSDGGRLGLGLAIVAEAVDRLGGQVSARNRNELDPAAPSGACFIVRFRGR